MKTIPGFHPAGARTTAFTGLFFAFGKTVPRSPPVLLRSCVQNCSGQFCRTPRALHAAALHTGGTTDMKKPATWAGFLDLQYPAGD